MGRTRWCNHNIKQLTGPGPAVALDVLVLDLAEARGEQVAGRREALDVLVEGHEVPLALLEDDAHLLRREQVQVLERVEIFRALCVDRRLVPRDPSGAAPRRRRLGGAASTPSRYGATFLSPPPRRHRRMVPTRQDNIKADAAADVAEELAAFC